MAPDYHNLPNEVLRIIFSALTSTSSSLRVPLQFALRTPPRECHSEATLLPTRRPILPVTPAFAKAVDCRGYRQGLNLRVRAIIANDADLGARVRSLNITVPEFTVEYDDEKDSGETFDALLPHLRTLTAFYLGPDAWPVPKPALLPSPTLLTPQRRARLPHIPRPPTLDKNGETPDVIPPDVIPCLDGVYCDSGSLYFCVLVGRRIEHISIVGCDISWKLYLDTLAGPMAVALSLSVLGQMSLQCTLRDDDVARYTHLELLAAEI
ncbi:hypothetical protein PLEOSDRAFT_154680 [Pleurotus ostreatus PC15]|uniref:Uncharacterized protein n=1 Tax=Pleurotus ostreatus (strain PC15) TaxID=1137138 RepID=A0A067P262_PLEO1|nr:hypothetical protein PLEOSDRAFT_154680 [Pleurotus ostreatus PC15]